MNLFWEDKKIYMNEGEPYDSAMKISVSMLPKFYQDLHLVLFQMISRNFAFHIVLISASRFLNICEV